MSNGIFPEWLNANAGRAYPLSEDSSRLDVRGSVRIPDSLIVSAQISATIDYMAGTFCVSEIGALPDTVSITIGFQPVGGDLRNIAVIAIPVATHSINRVYSFAGMGEDSCVLGSLTIGDITDTLEQVPAVADFAATATPFETSVIFCAVAAVKAVALYNGSDLVRSFGRILKLRAGENIRLTYVGNNTVRIDAILGENVTTASDCPNALPTLSCIKTINGLGPDANGNFEIDGGKCITVEASTGKILLTDTCSQSCCGCTELESLLSGLTSLSTQISDLNSQMNTTVSQQSTLIAGLTANIIP